MSWAKAVKEWNSVQFFKEDLYGIPRKGGIYYDDVKEIMERSKHKKDVEKMMGKEEKKEPPKIESEEKSIPRVVEPKMKSSFESRKMATPVEFTKDEFRVIRDEFRKEMAEEDEMAIEEKTASPKVIERHNKWLNSESDDSETQVEITRRIREQFPGFRVLTKKEEKSIPRVVEPPMATKETVQPKIESKEKSDKQRRKEKEIRDLINDLQRQDFIVYQQKDSSVRETLKDTRTLLKEEIGEKLFNSVLAHIKKQNNIGDLGITEEEDWEEGMEEDSIEDIKNRKKKYDKFVEKILEKLRTK